MLWYVLFFFWSRLIKIVYKKLKNIDCLMLHSVQETKYIFLLLLLLLLLQPTRSLNNTKNKISSGIKVAPKGDKLHFSDL